MSLEAFESTLLRSRRGVGWQAVQGRNDVAHGRATTLPAMVAVELAAKLSAFAGPRPA